jgi:hypothetical protein
MNWMPHGIFLIKYLPGLVLIWYFLKEDTLKKISNLLKLEDRLLVGVLDAEELRGGVPRLLLGVVQVQAQALHLSVEE